MRSRPRASSWRRNRKRRAISMTRSFLCRSWAARKPSSLRWMNTPSTVPRWNRWPSYDRALSRTEPSRPVTHRALTIRLPPYC
uniref:Putative secreted peptide n=1 Tax=Anopheles braziliensis TaxID=58242 RepID=A0A2M3ZQX9_9DIPT